MSDTQVAVLPGVQQFLDRQHGLWIEGRPSESHSEKRLEVFNPATGQVIASTADASAQDVDRAVMSGWRAFVARSWSGKLPAERERILLRFADLATDTDLLEWARECAPEMLDRFPQLAERHVARWLGGKAEFLKA